MSSARKEGESFDKYKRRRAEENREFLKHTRGHLAWASVQYYEKDGKKFKRSRTYIAPPEIKATKDVHRSSK